jgi:plastocyanin
MPLVGRTFARAAVVVLMLSLSLPATAAEPRGDLGADPLGTSEVHRVRMVDGNRFRPTRITISRGDRIRWMNRDNVAHTTTSKRGLWDERLEPGERFSRRFRRAGTFDYRCTIHFGMDGRIVVR